MRYKIIGMTSVGPFDKVSCTLSSSLSFTLSRDPYFIELSIICLEEKIKNSVKVGMRGNKIQDINEKRRGKDKL